MANNMFDDNIDLTISDIWDSEDTFRNICLFKNIKDFEECLSIHLSDLELNMSLNGGRKTPDIIAKDERGETVIIELQLGKCDKRHFDNILEYQEKTGAKSVIWVAEESTEEYINDYNKLNKTTSIDYYIVVVYFKPIEENIPEPYFIEIVGPANDGGNIDWKKNRKFESWGHKVSRFLIGINDRRSENDEFKSLIWSDELKDGYEFDYYFKRVNYPYKSYDQVYYSSTIITLNLNSSILEIYDDGKIFSSYYISYNNKKSIQIDFKPIQLFNEWKKNQKNIENLLGHHLDYNVRCNYHDYFKERSYSFSIEFDYHIGNSFIYEKEWPATQDVIIDLLNRMNKAFMPYIDKLI